MDTKKLTDIIHQAVAEFCNRKASEEHRGYAQAAWFAENGKEQIETKISEGRFVEWIQKAQELGYGIEDVLIQPFISTHSVWFSWTSFAVKIPIYGKYSCSFEKVNFPADSELPKAFITPFLERERNEAEELEAIAKAEQEGREAEKMARENEKLAWIQTHGSDYLKDAVTLGYNCQRQYVTERAAMEFPDYTVDFGGDAEWKSRSCPSMEALTEVKELVAAGHEAEVVWLTSPVDDDEPDLPAEYGGFNPCEAIAIREYLGKYDLVKIAFSISCPAE